MKYVGKRKNIQIIACAFISIMLLILNSTSAFATVTSTQMGGIYTNTPSGIDTFNDRASNVLWLIQAVGISVGVIMIAIVGVKYILSSPEGKAELKKQMIGYSIGAFLIISGATATNIIAHMAYNIN